MRPGLSWGPRPSLCRNPCFNFLSYSQRGRVTKSYQYRGVQATGSVDLPHRFFHNAARRLQEQTSLYEATPFAGHRRSERLRNASDAPRSGNVKVPRVPATKLKTPGAWIELLDPFLPLALRTDSSGKQGQMQLHAEDERDVCQTIIAILDSARKEQHTGVELLAHMVVNGQKPAALHIIGRLLKDISSRFPTRAQNRMPSNIQWPGRTMNDACKRPINLQHSALQTPHLTAGLHEEIEDPRHSFIATGRKEPTMTEVWSTLGALFAKAADLSKEQATDVSNAALLILGQIHNLDLVPESVYSYRHAPLTTTIQKPPILHLVSSRILAAISDATWRQQQDTMIENAANHGIPYETIGKDPPGGRFRLKVRPLGSEIWLEFILWCCVEGGFPSAGTRIVRSLQRQTDNPWFAVTWSSGDGRSQISPVVDWQRVRARYSGSVGFKEGYSDDKPFVEMPPRTISTEVVLALVDSSVNCVSPGTSRGGGALAVQRNIFELVAFLEPHDMPPSYFNYLAIRLMQAGVFELPQNPSTLHSWYKRLMSMKALRSTHSIQNQEPVLNLAPISAYSEVFAGILQQALDGCVQSGDIHRALDIFNSLQEMVDMSKLQAIDSFLHETVTQRATIDHNAGRIPRSTMKEFVGSHGQLPIYKLTGLIDLATDTGLTGFVQWLLYSNDPDGPLIPQSAYRDPSLTRALLRYASANQETALLREILRAHKRTRRLLSVNLLRTVIDTNIALLQFEQAYTKLLRLGQAQGGGLGLTNLAQLAAIIVKLESSNRYDLTNVQQEEALRRGHRLLEHMLDGDFDNRTGTFQAIVRRSFKQQIGALLQIFQTDSKSLLSIVGAKYTEQYSVANKAGLAPVIFNYIMEAVVQCKGSMEGMRLWNLCCQSCAKPGDLAFDEETTLVENGQGDDEGSNPIAALGEDSQELMSSEVFSEAEHEGSTTPSEKASTSSSTTLSTRPIGDDTINFTSFEDKFFPSSQSGTPSSSSQTRSLVKPSQQTLRLIIRGAVRERQEALRLGKKADVPKTVLAWAAEELKNFGATPRIISMELEEPLKQSRLQKLDEQRYALKRGDREHEAVVRRVSSSFIGQAQTRPSG